MRAGRQPKRLPLMSAARQFKKTALWSCGFVWRDEKIAARAF